MKVLVCDGLNTEAVAMLEEAGHDVDLHKALSKEDLLALCPSCDVLVVRSATKVTAEVMERATRLKLVVRGGVGLDNVDAKAAAARGVTVFNTPSATSVSVAELAIGLMLGLARHIPQANASVKSGAWERKAFAGSELFGKTLGLIGFGRIGQEVAKRALAFRMHVIAFDQAIDQEVVDVLEIESAPSLDAILPRADYLSLHLPYDATTHHVINRDRLAQMKTSAYLVNTARGELVDDAALAEALKAGRLAGAATDVYAKEPPGTDHPLVSLPNVITLPHVGASTGEGQKRAGLEVARIICEFAGKR